MMVSVIGIGAGTRQSLTGEAMEALRRCEVIAGYTVYIQQMQELFGQEKEYLTTPMTREEERCRLALELARQGRRVAMVSSGDAGVYGMAGLMLELAPGYPGVTVEVIPGVTAALSGAAVLGAPLGHDFAVISLSDLLTPWEKIEARLLAAAEGDFAIALYNPASRRRPDYLKRACGILLRRLEGDTPCGLVRQIGRTGQQARLLSLRELENTPVDMFTTVFIGSSQTKIIDGRLVTPRGYRHG